MLPLYNKVRAPARAYPDFVFNLTATPVRVAVFVIRGPG